MSTNPRSLIDPERLVARTVELVRMPSVNPFDGPVVDGTGEAAVAEWMSGHLERLSFDTTTSIVTEGRPNVVGVGPGGDGPVVCLSGHMDTVGITGYDHPFSGVVEAGRIHGRGSCDMKGALAAFVEVAEVVSASGTTLGGRLMIAAMADEEHAMAGSTHAGSHGPVADHLVVGEPTSLTICPAHKGQYAFPIRTRGRAVHSSIKHEGVNAIDHMVEIMEMLRHYDAELATGPRHDLLGHPSLNLGRISGGDMVSIVPDHCELHVDRRLLPGEHSGDVRAELDRRISSLATDRPDFVWEIGEPLVDARSLDTPRDAPVVVAAQRAMASRGLSADLQPFMAATDAPNLGGPAIIWGPGSISRAHTTNEWLEIDELVTAAHLYLDLVLDLGS